MSVTASRRNSPSLAPTTDTCELNYTNIKYHHLHVVDGECRSFDYFHAKFDFQIESLCEWIERKRSDVLLTRNH